MITLFLGMASATAQAGCYGSDAHRTCSDDTGNRYTVSKYGNTAPVHGSNASPINSANGAA